jgi:hypothetical protein
MKGTKDTLDQRPCDFDHDDFAPRGYHWDEKAQDFVPDQPKRKPLLRWDGERFVDNEVMAGVLRGARSSEPVDPVAFYRE